MVYHCTWLSELLNKVRWGIQMYVQMAYYDAHKMMDDRSYTYRLPAEMKDDFATACYWNLMQAIRSGPSVPEFVGAAHFKRRY